MMRLVENDRYVTQGLNTRRLSLPKYWARYWG